MQQWIVPVGLAVLNLVTLGVTAFGKWGMSNKKDADIAAAKAIADRLDAAEKKTTEVEKMCNGHSKEIQHLREKSVEADGFIRRATDDAHLTLEALSRITDRVQDIGDRMVTKQDLQIMFKFRND